MGEKFNLLQEKLKLIANMNSIGGLLGWDQQVKMPRGAVEARASQLEALTLLVHPLATSAELGELISEAEAELNGADYDSDEASIVRIARKDYDDQVKYPTEFVAEMNREVILGHEVWAEARAKNDFASFLPTLRKIIDLKKRAADYLGYEDHPYDALLSEYDRDLKANEVRTIFDQHKAQIVPLIEAIKANHDTVDDSVVHRHFDVNKQEQFGREIIKTLGFDFNRGRTDVSVHPFCSSFSRTDVRLTTRFYPDFLNPALFGLMHEAGHGMYEQGVGANLAGTNLESGTSLSVHESQSRMWENIVGRSLPFWEWAYPSLQSTFPESLGDVDLNTFYKSINRVKPSFIRVEADEATYNLHIMLRFELEMDMISGNVDLAKLPQIWAERFESYIGVVPPNDSEGVLQDVHWSSGLVGYFATYALGNLLAAQYFNQALKAHPNLMGEFAQGKFDTLLTWLNQNIHVHGRKFTTNELTQRLVGEGINQQYYADYLRQKYTSIYGL